MILPDSLGDYLPRMLMKIWFKISVIKMIASLEKLNH